MVVLQSGVDRSRNDDEHFGPHHLHFRPQGKVTRVGTELEY